MASTLFTLYAAYKLYKKTILEETQLIIPDNQRVIPTELLSHYSNVHINTNNVPGTDDCTDIRLVVNKPCDLSDPSACSSCKGQYRCTRDGDKLYLADFTYLDYPANKSQGFCTPIPDKSICNEYAGRAVLIKQGSTLTWYCQPRYPTIVTKSTANGDVDIVVACAGVGTLINPLTKVPWIEERNYSPALATCKCPSGFIPADETIHGTYTSCAPDPCAPGKDDQTGGCICPTGYLPCPSLAFSTDEEKKLCPHAAGDNYKICVPDPCTVGNSSFMYSFASGKCERRDGTNIEDNPPGTFRSIYFTKDMPLRGITFSTLGICSMYMKQEYFYHHL